MKLIADMMLGRLARWLRLYGYDTLYGIEEDDEILRTALEEGRMLLSRDEELVKRAKKLGIRAILIDSNSFEAQIDELKREGFEFAELFPANARCPKCNGLILPVSKDEVRNKVPESIYQKYDEFYICTNCGQIYWPGRQWEEMIRIDRKIRNKGKPNVG
ncbi:Mut7-C RNAse domain-containing protein [Thermococcus sp.]